MIGQRREVSWELRNEVFKIQSTPVLGERVYEAPKSTK